MVTFYIHCQCDNVHVNLNTKSAGMKASGFFSERVMISVKRVQRVVVILLKARTEPAVKVNVYVLALLLTLRESFLMTGSRISSSTAGSSPGKKNKQCICTVISMDSLPSLS